MSIVLVRDARPDLYAQFIQQYINAGLSPTEARQYADNATIDVPDNAVPIGDTPSMTYTPSSDPLTGGSDVVDQYEAPLSGTPSAGIASWLGLPAIISLSTLTNWLPDWAKTPFLSFLAAAGIRYGATIAIRGLIAALVDAGTWALPVIAVLEGIAIVTDSVLVDVDLPFTPSIPLPSWATIGGADNVPPATGTGGMGGVGNVPSGSNLPVLPGGQVNFAVAQHGPVVKQWMANGLPFYKFMDGYCACQAPDGWSFWKPKKPVVYVPGGAMSRKVARKMARIYKHERDEAKKTFGLVEKRQPTRNSHTKSAENVTVNVTE